MAKKHHWGRKDRPQRVCNPDTCPNCMYGGEKMKAHVEPRSRECPFCGAPTYEVVSVTGMKCVRCTNKKNCGAIVSFNNKDCDERGVSPAVYFNRRAGKE